MAKTTRERARRGGESGRGSGRDADALGDDAVADGASNTVSVDEMADDAGVRDADDDTPVIGGDLIAAALVGAALGAGLGLLATRLLDTDDMHEALGSVRRNVGRGVRRGVRAAGRGAGAAGGAASAVRDYAASAREVFEDVLEREVRSLRRAARRRRRQLGF